jgi:hypothetical protein
MKPHHATALALVGWYLMPIFSARFGNLAITLAGFHGYLVKPLDTTELEKLIA